MIIQGRSKRKSSGGRFKSSIEKKKKYKLARSSTLTKLDERRTQTVKQRGKDTKTRLLTTNKVNLYDPKTKKYSTEAIKTIADSPSNANYIRRNIMTKGTVIETSKGKAVITSRPGQIGILNAKLVQ